MKRLLAVLVAFVLPACDSNPRIASLEIVPNDTLLVAGTELQLEVIAWSADGRNLGAPTWTEVFWSSVGEGVALGRHGLVRAVAYGETEVTAQVEEHRATATIRVNPSLEDLRAAAVYINQVNQNPESPIPLVAGRPGLFRLFIVVDADHYYTEPPKVRVAFTGGPDTVLVQESSSIRRSLDEGSMDFSYNLFLPGDMIASPLRARITYDPDGEIAGIGGSQEVAFDVANLSIHEQVLVPFISTAHPRPQVTDWTDGFAYRSAHAYEMRTFLPISEEGTKITVHDVVSTDHDLRVPASWRRWLNEVRLISQLEGSAAYYYGAQRLPGDSRILGIAYLGGRAAAGADHGHTLAHEVGHNMGLGHAPCRTSDPDPSYPYEGGGIGRWGVDLERMELVDPDRHSDHMGYCTNVWVSDYSFGRALQHRINAGDGARQFDPESVLLLWGSVTDERFEPAFVTVAPATPPDPEGRYLAEGFGDDGRRVFAHRFNPLVASTGHEAFVLAVPVDPTASLASVTVSGPGIAMTLTDGSVPPMLIERDALGQIRAIRRDYAGPNPPSGSLLSTGLRGTRAHDGAARSIIPKEQSSRMKKNENSTTK